ncbi:MAG: DUF5615 family PIN-like protein [Pseudomonadota bacterium]
MRFLCDEMLTRLARLLRSAGHDTALAGGGAPDADLLTQAKAEGRLLLTRDRELAQAAHPDSVRIEGDGVLDQARSLSAAVEVDWLAAPFTRCAMDNAELRAADAQERSRMPAEARSGSGPFRTCPVCGRLYWPGSHVRRIRARLEGLAGQA